jgi:hypothetical protein
MYIPGLGPSSALLDTPCRTGLLPVQQLYKRPHRLLPFISDSCSSYTLTEMSRGVNPWMPLLGFFIVLLFPSPSTQCELHGCKNQGVCVYWWNPYTRARVYTCDCDATSYTGPNCSDESIAYKFGQGVGGGGSGGLISYTFPEGKSPDTRRDTLTVGFVTQHEDAVIAKVESGNSSEYLELELVQGNVFVVYNLGNEDHIIEDHFLEDHIFKPVNDGQYHVVRFRRNGYKSTLQVDNRPVKAHSFNGFRQQKIFNQILRITIGGKKDPEGNVMRPFHGIQAGVVFDGLRVLDLAASRHASVAIKGVVERQGQGTSVTTPTTLDPSKASICGEGRWMCANGRKCIQNWRRCDGKQETPDDKESDQVSGNCDDGLDEHNCQAWTCLEGYSKCDDRKQCVTDWSRCNGEKDCEDGSDEQNCQAWTCAEGFSKCDHGKKCIKDTWRCDGAEDCEDKSDEQNCQAWTCAEGFSKCDHGKECIKDTWRCDGAEDCEDGSDEQNCQAWTCAEGQSKCNNGKECVSHRLRCDGYKDCDDGLDE